MRTSFPTIRHHLAISTLLLAPLPAREYFRPFTSTDGKTLHGTLVSADDATVTLNRAADDREFTLPIERLSKPDQEYIERWRAKTAPVEHPLGWKRLKIHAPPRTEIAWGCDTIPLTAECEATIELPVGAWLKIECSALRHRVIALKRFGGESDWFIGNTTNPQITVSTERGKPGDVIGIFVGSGQVDAQGVTRIRPGDQVFVADQQTLQAIQAGASVYGSEPYLKSLLASGAEPRAIVLEGDGSMIAWEDLPPDLEAIDRTVRGPVALAGIEALEKLQALSLDSTERSGAGARPISGVAALSEIPELTSVTLAGTLTPDELSALGGASELSYLAVTNQALDPGYMDDTFGFLGALGALEVIRFPNLSIGSVTIPPPVAKSCPRVTSYGFTGLSWEAFTADLPNLTRLSTASGLLRREDAEDLMDSGHFQHVRELYFAGHFALTNLPELHTLKTRAGVALDRLTHSGPLPKLRTLQLEVFTAEELEKLSTLAIAKTVERIELLSTTGLTDEHFVALAKFPALTELSLDAQMRPVPKIIDLGRMPDLRALSIKFASRRGAIDAIINMDRLVSLRLDTCSVKKLSARSGCPILESLIVEGDQALADLTGLRNCPKLRTLYVQTSAPLNSGRLENSPKLQSAMLFHAGREVIMINGEKIDR